ncbi:hypothetical protein F1C76_01430 [Geodermatophilaceae bacterium NBWT11]|nr:hypothetical protein F1C76_01430 [Geodermatophilaceae bacterium NBWT11]
MRGALDWLFVDRTDPERRWVLGQWPNVMILVFLVLTVIASFVADDGAWGTALYVGTRIAILWWAADELFRGVNPFRRLTGAGVLVFVLAGVAQRL